MVRSTQNIPSKKQVGTKDKKDIPVRATKPGRGSRHKHVFNLLPTVSKPELLDENGGSDRTFRQFLYDFSVLATYMESARTYLASHIDLSSPQYNIVMILAQYQGAEGMSVSDVAQHLHVTTAFITGEIRKLEQDGLVEKRPNPNDGRGILLRLTADGEASVQRIGSQRLLVNNHLFRSLSGEDFHHLSKTVASLIDDFAQTIDMLKVTRKDRVRRLK